MKNWIRAIAMWTVLLALLHAQQAPSVPVQPPPAATAPQPTPPAVTAVPAPSGKLFLNLQNASLTAVIENLARQLKINYILDPRVKGSVTLNTYGELREVDARNLLETILRVNGAAMVQVGEVYRIVPLSDVPRLPMSPKANLQLVPDNEQISLNLIFLKFATVTELSKLLEKFLGEGATMITSLKY